MSFGEYEVRLKVVGDPVAYDYDERDVSLVVRRSEREPAYEDEDSKQI